jgi:hypothetical protein
MTEEVARLKFETIGIDGLNDLRKKLEDVQKQSVELADAFGRGEVKEKEFAAQSKILEKSQADLSRGIADVEKAFDIVARASERAADAELRAAEKEVVAFQKAEIALEEAAARAQKARAAAAAQAVREADRIAAAEIKVAEAEAARAAKLEESLEPAKNKMASFGQAAIQTSYALQDLVSGGFGGILNNIPSIAQAFGGGAGLAGIVGGLGLAAFLAKDQIASAFKAIMFEAFDPLRDRAKELEKTIEEIEKRPHKVAVDILELEAARDEAERVRAAMEAVERLRTGQTEAEQKSGRAVQEAVGEAPGGSQAVLAALRSQFIQELTTPLKERMAAETADDRRRLAESEAALRSMQAQGRGGTEAAAQVIGLINNLKDRLAKADQALSTEIAAVTAKKTGQADIDIGDLMKQAEKGAGGFQAAAQEQLRRRLEQAGFGRTGFELGQATPEAVRATEREQRDYENQRRQAKLRKDLEKREEDAQKKVADDLEQQLHNRDVNEKQLSDATEKTRKEAEKQQKDQAAAVAAAERRRLATLARRIGGGTLGEEAQDYAARVQEARPGISDADLRAAVQAAVAAEVARRAPQLAPAERAGVVGAVTEQALAAPPEDVAARQARAAAALPRQERAEMQAGYAQEAQARGANPQQAAQIGRLATAAFAKTGDLQGSFMQGVMEFQQIMGRMLAQQQGLMNGMQQVHANNRNMQARLQTAQKEWGR